MCGVTCGVTIFLYLYWLVERHTYASMENLRIEVQDLNDRNSWKFDEHFQWKVIRPWLGYNRFDWWSCRLAFGHWEQRSHGRREKTEYMKIYVIYTLCHLEHMKICVIYSLCYLDFHILLAYQIKMLYESPRRKPGWRFTAGIEFWVYLGNDAKWTLQPKWLEEHILVCSKE